jgi:arylsulfatase
MVVHWPKGIKAKGELRTQFHHVIDIVPTILQAAGLEAPRVINSVQQEPIEGVPMNYSFDDARAETTHPTQYFEMLGNRAIIDRGWKAVTYHGRKPWENKAAWSFDQDHWELYDLERDPSECHDLAAEMDVARFDDPIVKKLFQLVGLWWAEAGRYGVLPLDDRFQSRLMDRAELGHARTKYTFYTGAVRIAKDAAPDTRNRSWTMTAEIEVPSEGAEGPIAVIGGDTAGWSLYLKDGVPTFCYNFAAAEFTYIRAQQALAPGKHVIRYEFEMQPETSDTGKPVAYGAGGTGRLYVDRKKVAEAEIPRTMAFDYSLDETFDIGCDKGSPVTNEYRALASFTGKIIHVTLDLDPEVAFDAERHTAAHAQAAMVRQ